MTTPPSADALDSQVDVAGDEIFPSSSETAPRTKRLTKDLVSQVSTDFNTTLFEKGLTARFILMLRMFLQLVLMHLRTPPTLKAVAQTPYADTMLVPAARALLAGAPAITENDPRALRGLDLTQIKSTVDNLESYRKVAQELSVALESVEAGISQMQQYVDTAVRAAYPRVKDLIEDDRQIARELGPLSDLMQQPVEQAQETRKSKKKAKEETRAEVERAKAAAAAAAATAGSAPAATGGTGGAGVGGASAGEPAAGDKRSR